MPFVDVLTTISDPSIPLTTIEWEEWGNPLATREYYEYIKSYSPVDNVVPQRCVVGVVVVVLGLSCLSRLCRQWVCWSVLLFVTRRVCDERGARPLDKVW